MKHNSGKERNKMRRFPLDWRGCPHFHIWDMSWDLLNMQIYENAKQKFEHNEITLGEFEEMIKPLETAFYFDYER